MPLGQIAVLEGMIVSGFGPRTDDPLRVIAAHAESTDSNSTHPILAPASADFSVLQIATATTVPEEETSHGFEGHLLDGAVTLKGRSGPERIRLAGSGKGPTGAVSAVDMALRGFGDHLKLTEIFEENCRGD